MEFTDEVPDSCRVTVRGCSAVQRAGFGGDRRLAMVVLEILWESGYRAKGLNIENLGEFFQIVNVTQEEIVVAQIAEHQNSKAK